MKHLLVHKSVHTQDILDSRDTWAMWISVSQPGKSCGVREIFKSSFPRPMVTPNSLLKKYNNNSDKVKLRVL